MFFNYKHMAEFGYAVLGINTENRHSCYNYVKYFDDDNSIVVFSTIQNNRLIVFKLTTEDYNSFKKGDYALATNNSDEGKTPAGYEIKRKVFIVVYNGGEIKSRVTLKKKLDKAEALAVL